MLAASCARQLQANLVDLAPAAWDQQPRAWYGNVNFTVSLPSATERQKYRRDALIELGSRPQCIANLGCLELRQPQIDSSGFSIVLTGAVLSMYG